MTNNHPYVLPGYALMEIPQCQIIWHALTKTTKPKTQSKLISLIYKKKDHKKSAVQVELAPEIMDLEAYSNNIKLPDFFGVTPKFKTQNKNKIINDPFTSSVIENQNQKIKMRSFPAIIMAFISVAMCVGIYVNDSNNINKKAIIQIAGNAVAKQIPVKNELPQNIANELDVYYHTQPHKADRIIIETDSFGCEWKVAFNSSVNIPKGRYPSLTEEKIHKCREAARAVRPEVMRIPKGQEPKEKIGTSIAIVNVINPATGMTDKNTFASYINYQPEQLLDKKAIDAIIKSEIARAKKTAPSVSFPTPVMDKPKIKNSRYPGIEYKNRPTTNMPTTNMPSMPGNAGLAGDDRPTYIPYIPGMPYTAPESLNKPSQLRSIKPKVSGGIVKKEMVPQMQSARPGGVPTELREMASQPGRNFASNANGIPSGNPVLEK